MSLSREWAQSCAGRLLCCFVVYSVEKGTTELLGRLRNWRGGLGGG